VWQIRSYQIFDPLSIKPSNAFFISGISKEGRKQHFSHQYTAVDMSNNRTPGGVYKKLKWSLFYWMRRLKNLCVFFQTDQKQLGLSLMQ